MIRVQTHFGWIAPMMVKLVAALVIGLATLAASPDMVMAQKKPSAATSKAYAQGVKAFDSGKTDTAIASLTSALRSGGLSGPDMAKALFYRGTAYRKKGKPALAISDLTSAVWIKGGLSDKDREAALKQRQGAYKEAGLGASAPATLTPDGGVPSTAPSKKVALKAPAANPPRIKSDNKTATATSAWQTTANEATAAKQAAAPAASAPSSSSAPSVTPSIAGQLAPPPSTGLSAMPVGDSGTTPTTGLGETASSVGQSIGQSLSGVGSFFSNMFSSEGGQTSAGAPPATATAPVTSLAPVTTTGSTAPATPPASSAQGWGTNTAAVAPPAAAQKTAKKPVQVAARAPASVPAPKPVAAARKTSKPLGKFKLQVAALRSEREAQQVAARLQREFGAKIGNSRPEIDAAAIGNMGTFYRVRVGPYASIDKPKELCAALLPKGFDCLVVTQ
jgi:SPOR domain